MIRKCSAATVCEHAAPAKCCKYIRKDFNYGNFRVPLLVSQSACTDFDLTGVCMRRESQPLDCTHLAPAALFISTRLHCPCPCPCPCPCFLTGASTPHHAAAPGSAGQILWPAAELLAAHLAANPRWAEGRSCALELGAGLGLVGCVAARSCPVVLTDHNEDVLLVLRRNADLNRAQHGELRVL